MQPYPEPVHHVLRQLQKVLPIPIRNEERSAIDPQDRFELNAGGGFGPASFVLLL